MPQSNPDESSPRVQNFALAWALYYPMLFGILLLSIYTYNENPWWRLIGQVIGAAFISLQVGLRIWAEIGMRKSGVKRSWFQIAFSWITFVPVMGGLFWVLYIK